MAFLAITVMAVTAGHAATLTISDKDWIQALQEGRKSFSAPSKNPLILLLPEAAVLQGAQNAVAKNADGIALKKPGGTAKWQFTIKEEGLWIPFLVAKHGAGGKAELIIDGIHVPFPSPLTDGFTRVDSKPPIKLSPGEHSLEIGMLESNREDFTVYGVAFSTDASLARHFFDAGSPKVNSCLIRGFAKKLWRDFPLQCDWFLQDNQVHGEWGADFGADSRGDLAAYLKADRDNSLEAQLLSTVAKEIGVEINPLTLPAGDPKWLEEYVGLCQKRREARLKPLASLAPQIVYAVHHNMGSIYLATDTQGGPKGSEMRILDLSPLAKGEPIKDEQLFDPKGGIVRDPEISFDGKRMLFAWCKTSGGANTVGQIAPATGNYKIYEMELATRAVRQLTTDETYGADFEPCYLPNGDILFSSDRCVQEVTCGWGDCANLYLMNKDGKYARRIGFDQTQTAFPHLLDDGRIVYTRRDYNDRGQTYAHALFVMNPDGTKQTEYYKNNSCEPTSLQHTRQIPGTTKTMSIAGGYHCDQGGKLTIIDINKGRQAYEGLTFINWDPSKMITSGDNFGREGEQYTYPFPLDASSFLVGFDPIGGYMFNKEGRVVSQQEHYRLYYMSVDGKREMLSSHPVLSSAQSAPVMPRKTPPDRPALADYTKNTGLFYVQNVYYGQAVTGIKKGSIKKIRVNELYYKPITLGIAMWGPPHDEIGPGKRYSSVFSGSVTPVGVGTASFDAKGILGEVNVEEDGSALFEVPARTPLFLQLIDENGYVAQTMRSWSTLMPGENFSCVGCHEVKGAPPLPNAQRTLAMQRAPQKIQPFAGVSGKPFSYAKLIQPIWNRECVSCHAPGKETQKIDLTDTLVVDYPEQKKNNYTERNYYQSYLTLLRVVGRQAQNWLATGMPNEWVNYWTRLRTVELIPPYDAGSAKSKLITLLKNKHRKTNLSENEIQIVSAWIDLNVPFIGEYDEMNAWTEAESALYKAKLGLRRKNEAIEQKNIENFIKDGQP